MPSRLPAVERCRHADQDQGIGGQDHLIPVAAAVHPVEDQIDHQCAVQHERRFAPKQRNASHSDDQQRDAQFAPDQRREAAIKEGAARLKAPQQFFASLRRADKTPEPLAGVRPRARAPPLRMRRAAQVDVGVADQRQQRSHYARQYQPPVTQHLRSFPQNRNHQRRHNKSNRQHMRQRESAEEGEED